MAVCKVSLDVAIAIATDGCDSQCGTHCDADCVGNNATESSRLLHCPHSRPVALATSPLSTPAPQVISATATMPLEELLAQPLATARPQGALAGAAGIREEVVHDAPISTDVPVSTDSSTLPSEGEGEAIQNVEATGEGQVLETPELAPAVAPVSATLPPVLAEPVLAEGAVTPDGVERTLHVPILMYHYLSTPPGDADIYRRDLSVAPELFAQQLDRLQSEGFTTISFYDFMQALTTGAPLPEKPVILTFDDGYRDNYENAFPALRDRGMTATFFVVTDFIDEARDEYLTWDMARGDAGGRHVD